MGWFDEQIKQRVKQDDEMFTSAFTDISSVVMGEHILYQTMNGQKQMTAKALQDILNYYHISDKFMEDMDGDAAELLDEFIHSSGLMKRTVELTKGWYKDAQGAMLGSDKNGIVIALIPYRYGGYAYRDPETGEFKRVNKQTEENISTEAFCFYKAFPQKSMEMSDLVKYMLGLLNRRDLAVIIGITLLITALGICVPILNQYLFSDVIGYGNQAILWTATMVILCITLSMELLTIIKKVFTLQIETKISVSVEAATMMRTLTLPADFFKKYSAGELAGRIQNMNKLCSTFITMLLTTGFTACFSIIYIVQIIAYTPSLVKPALFFTLLTFAFSLFTAYVQTKVSRKLMYAENKEGSLVYSLVTGVQKIKNTGAEKRAFSKWEKSYKKVADYQYNPPMFLKINSVIMSMITFLGMVVMYYIAVENRIAPAEYMAFNSAYGMVSGAFIALSRIASAIAVVVPIVEMIEPVFKTEPEITDKKSKVSRISGAIELNNVFFRYNESMPYVLNDLSLKINAGQYVAIVGTTGCGKSTLMRILLGFEQPNRGAVYYDGKDLSKIDLRSLRRKIGVVMQNGKLFQGDIFSNIIISAPQLNMEDAWEAARMAGMEDDINHMPMGMFTLISEGNGGISGGQRQRLLIARAVAPKPKILILDEATSALDNITQKIVSDSLDRLKCTRIVIAHRLSTIKNCDRIIVLDHGKIVEDGTYNDLISQNGIFADLVERQQVKEG